MVQSPPKKKADLRRSKKLGALLRTKYAVVGEQAQGLGWHLDSGGPAKKEEEENESRGSWNVCWMDHNISLQRVMRLRRTQKVNHFPGMLALVRKAGTARHLNRMLEAVGKVRLSGSK